MRVRDVVHFLRRNPQVAILVVICLVLGIFAVVATVFGLLASGHGGSSEPGALVAAVLRLG